MELRDTRSMVTYLLANLNGDGISDLVDITEGCTWRWFGKAKMNLKNFATQCYITIIIQFNVKRSRYMLQDTTWNSPALLMGQPIKAK